MYQSRSASEAKQAHLNCYNIRASTQSFRQDELDPVALHDAATRRDATRYDVLERRYCSSRATQASVNVEDGKTAERLVPRDSL